MNEEGMRIYLDQRGEIPLNDAPGIHFEVLSSNALCWVKISKDMKIFKFFTIYRKFLKFLPTFYSFLLFLTIWTV